MVLKNILILNNNIKKKKKKFFLKNTKKTLQFLKFLLQLNILKNINIITQNQIYCELTFFKNKPIIKKLKYYKKPFCSIFLKKKDINTLLKCKNTFYILNTSSGFLTSFESYKQNTGGFLFIKIIL